MPREPLPLVLRARLATTPFESGDFLRFCQMHIGEASALSYTEAAETLFRHEEYRAKHWTWEDWFLPETRVTLASDFVALSKDLIAMEENLRPLNGTTVRTPMRGALTYLEKYQRRLLDEL